MYTDCAFFQQTKACRKCRSTIDADSNAAEAVHTDKATSAWIIRGREDMPFTTLYLDTTLSCRQLSITYL